MLASGGDAIYLWDVKSQKQMGILRGHTGAVRTIAYSPDGNLLASGGQDSSIRFWDVHEQKQVGIIQNLEGMVNSVAFSPDGKWLASGGADSAVRIWDVEEYKQVALWNVGFVNSVAFSSNGKWLASGGARGAGILLWEVNITVPGISVEPMGKLPSTWGGVKKTALLQNYPNPFNPETWIPYNLSKPEHVTIKIYSITGQLVRTLDLGKKSSGEYFSKDKAAHWDGRNEAGEAVASNIYFCVMEAGESRYSRKMVVAR
jgi:WD40 repeat protein